MPYVYSSNKLRVARWMERIAGVLFGTFRTLRTPAPPEANPTSILIVEPFQMGDVVSLSVMLDPLKHRFPQARISIFTQAKNAEVYEGDDRVESLETCPIPWAQYRGKQGTLVQWRQLWKTLRRLRVSGFDVGIDPRGDIRSQIVMVLAGCRRRIGPTNYLGSNMVVRGDLLTDSLGPLPTLHRYEINRRVLEPVLGPELPPLALPSLRYPGIPTASAPPGQKRVVVHIGGGWVFKRWPVERWAETINRLGKNPMLSIVTMGGAGEKDILDDVQKMLNVECDVRTTTFPELIALIKGADLFLGLDSGPMNLAVALGCPVIALFGPGDSETWYPLGVGDVFLHVREGYPCNPCFQRECAFADRSCMTRIDPEAVVAEAEKRLGEVASNR